MSPPDDVLLRPLRPGDLGWVIARHGEIYAEEYGWDWRFEALVAGIAAQFVERFDAAREMGWIAERKGVRLGCVFLVQARDDADAVQAGTAQLRMLLLDPQARGLGLGKRLVRACTEFAAQAGYARIKLWTNQQLSAARGIYEREGYQLTGSETHHSFGHEMVGETWELVLD